MINSLSTAKSREEIYQALFDLVIRVTFPIPINGRSTWGGGVRKFVDPDQVDPDQWPFLAQFEGFPETYEQHTRIPQPVRELGARLFCWTPVASGDALEIGSRYITVMLEAIESALQPDHVGFGARELCTLGGLVQWARIEGTVLKFPGDTERQAMVCVPVKILWP